MAAANVIGTYIYEKPGSGEKSLKTLEIKAGGVVNFKEEGENSIETYTITGPGSWSISSDGIYVVIRFPKLTKLNKPKKAQLVPGLDAPHITEDDGFDIPVNDLVNAKPGLAKHKWKRA